MLYTAQHTSSLCGSNGRPFQHTLANRPSHPPARVPCWHQRVQLKASSGSRPVSTMVISDVTREQATEQDFTWKGTDEFSDLNDRQDQTPVPLPALKESKRVVLVRHGQSTWNAEGRVQGSTDFAVLTDKGRSQADTTRMTVRAINCH